jgi:hypothetical protein
MNLSMPMQSTQTTTYYLSWINELITMFQSLAASWSLPRTSFYNWFQLCRFNFKRQSLVTTRTPPSQSSGTVSCHSPLPDWLVNEFHAMNSHCWKRKVTTIYEWCTWLIGASKPLSIRERNPTAIPHLDTMQILQQCPRQIIEKRA